MIRLALDFPPSANRLWRAVGGRNIESKPYREWKQRAAARLHIPGGWAGHGLEGPYVVRYVAQRPDRRRRDVENLPKALADALVTAGVVRDDSDCMRSTVEWAEGEPRKGALVLIELEPW